MASPFTDVTPETTGVPSNAPEEVRVRALVEALSNYIEQYHGGAVEVVSYDGETLAIKMSGACVGCPLSVATLHGWVGGTVRQFFPNVKRVEAA